MLQEAPRALSRTFTLMEAAELLGRTAAGQTGGDDDLRARTRALVARMAAARAGRPSGLGDDIADPIGRPVEAHQAAGDAIVAALLPLLERITAPAQAEQDGVRGTTHPAVA